MLNGGREGDSPMQIGSRWYGKGSKKVLKIAEEVLQETEEERDRGGSKEIIYFGFSGRNRDSKSSEKVRDRTLNDIFMEEAIQRRRFKRIEE